MSNLKQGVNEISSSYLSEKATSMTHDQSLNNSKKTDSKLFSNLISNNDLMSRHNSVQTESSLDSAVIPIQQYKNKLKISRTKRNILFLVLFFSNVAINLDHGAIPGATDEIGKAYHTHETELGTFGALVYFGVAVGALILIFIIHIINRKYMIIFSLLANAVLILSFTAFNNVIYLCFNRFVTGIFQAMISIYIPIWIDQFGQKNIKTILMTFFHLSSIGGLIMGYLITMEVKKFSSWKISFIIEAGMSAGLAIPYVFYSFILFSSDYHRIENVIEKEMVVRDSNESSDELHQNLNNEDNTSNFGEFHKDETSTFSKDFCKLVKEPVSILNYHVSNLGLYFQCFICNVSNVCFYCYYILDYRLFSKSIKI